MSGNWNRAAPPPALRTCLLCGVAEESAGDESLQGWFEWPIPCRVERFCPRCVAEYSQVTSLFRRNAEEWHCERSGCPACRGPVGLV